MVIYRFSVLDRLADHLDMRANQRWRHFILHLRELLCKQKQFCYGWFKVTETISDTERDLWLKAFTLSVQKSATVNTLTHGSIQAIQNRCQSRYGSLSLWMSYYIGLAAKPDTWRFMFQFIELWKKVYQGQLWRQHLPHVDLQLTPRTLRWTWSGYRSGWRGWVGAPMDLEDIFFKAYEC